MENKKRKRWQNKKVVLSGVLSAAMVLQPLSMVTASAANVTAPYAAGDVETDTADAKITKVDAVTAYTIEGVKAALPDTVTATTNADKTIQKAVTWNTEGVDLTKDDQTVSGTVEGYADGVTATIKVVNPNMQYFIDCNSLSSPKYVAMNAYADLLNEAPDQKYDGDNGADWGYLDDYGARNPGSDESISDEYASGWYAYKNQDISYTIPMKKGTYTLTLGFKEWWRDGNKYNSRKMTVTAIHDGETETLGETQTWENSSNWWNRDFYTLTCKEDGDVTITLSKAGNNDPTLSFIQVQNMLHLDALKEAINDADDLDTSEYSADKVAALTDEVKAAKTLLLKASTTQDDVDTAVEKITAAKEALNQKDGLTEAELAANDYILYQANCGTSDVTVTPSGTKSGLYQTDLDQAYGEDDAAGYRWGYVEDDTYSKTVRGGDTTLKGSYRYQSDKITYEAEKSGIGYDFDLPNGKYQVTVGIDNPWSQWGTKYEDILLEGNKVESKLTAKDFEKTYDVTVDDGTLNVFVQANSRSSTSDDPIVNYIIVKAIPSREEVSALALLKATVENYKAKAEGKNYSTKTKEAFDKAISDAEALIKAESTDETAINDAKTAIETAFENLKVIKTYSSISGTKAEIIYDTNCVEIQAHGGQVQKWGDTYYWYGEDKTNGYRPVEGVHLYTSKDLYNWDDQGVVLKSIPVSEEDYGKDQESDYKADLSIFEEDDYYKELYGDYADKESDFPTLYDSKLEETYWNLANDRCVIERPKVIYNKKNNNYVMWFHADGRTPKSSADYGKALAGVAISDSPTGPFKLVGTYLLCTDDDAHNSVSNQWDNEGGHVRDMNLFVDDDGQAYVMYSSEANAIMYIAKLNDDYTALIKDREDMVLGEDFCISSRDSREAPAMFKYRDKYYLITSGCTGWAPNQAAYAVADSPLGPWTRKGDPCVGDSAGNTFSSQSTCVIPVDAENGKFIYMGDHWTDNNQNSLSDHPTYMWLPVEFGMNDTIALKNYSDWTLEDLEGKGAVEVLSDLPQTVTSLTELKEKLPTEINVKLGGKTTENKVVLPSEF